MGSESSVDLIKVFVETKLDTRLLLTVPQTCTINELQGQIEAHHLLLFPEIGQTSCRRLELPAPNGKAFAIVGSAFVKDLKSKNRDESLEVQAILLQQDGQQEGSLAQKTGVKQSKKRSKPPLGVQKLWKKQAAKGKHASRASLGEEKHIAEQPENPSSSNRASTHNGPGLCDGNSTPECYMRRSICSREEPSSARQTQEEAPIQQPPGSGSGAADILLTLSSGQPKAKRKKVETTISVDLPEQHLHVESAAIAPEDNPLNVEKKVSQASDSVPESEAETEAGSGGKALLEVVPETQPVLASPGSAVGEDSIRQKRKSQTAGGPTSSGTQNANLDLTGGQFKADEPASSGKTSQSSESDSEEEPDGTSEPTNSRVARSGELKSSSGIQAQSRDPRLNQTDAETPQASQSPSSSAPSQDKHKANASAESENKAESSSSDSEASHKEEADEGDEEEEEEEDIGEQAANAEDETPAAEPATTETTEAEASSDEEAEGQASLVDQVIHANKAPASQAESDSSSEEEEGGGGAATSANALAAEVEAASEDDESEEEQESGEEESEDEDRPEAEAEAVSQPQEAGSGEAGEDELEITPEAQTRKTNKVTEDEISGDQANGSDESESDEQYLIRTKKVAPGHPNYFRTLRLSASHEEAKRMGRPYPRRRKKALDFGANVSSEETAGVTAPSKKRKSQVEPEEGRQEEAVEEKQKAAKKAQNEGSKKQKQQPSKKSEYELEPDTDEIEENQKNADADKEEGNDEEDIIKGLCPHAKFVLEKPLSTYPTGKDGKKELVKNARDALRDQMSFEGKNKAKLFSAEKAPDWWPLEKWDFRQLDSLKNVQLVLDTMRRHYGVSSQA